MDDGLKPVWKVTTRLGRTVEATSPHPFLTVDGWKKLADLKPGEHIAVPRKLEVFGDSYQRECELKILAYLIGDGCLTHNSPGFTNSNPTVRADFSNAVADFGGMTTRYNDSNGTRTPGGVSWLILGLFWRIAKIFAAACSWPSPRQENLRGKSRCPLKPARFLCTNGKKAIAFPQREVF